MEKKAKKSNKTSGDSLHHPASDRSTKEPTASSALLSCEGSLPPASAISGFPPPLPPTIAETSFASFPAWLLASKTV
jgi:hypothetical protein